MSLIKKVTKYQRAVWWKFNHEDGQGNPVFDAPMEIGCRWEERSEVFTDKRGAERVSKAKVFVDQDVRPDDVLWQGTMDEVLYVDEPLKNQGAYRVEGWRKIPNRKAKEFLRLAFL